MRRLSLTVVALCFGVAQAASQENSTAGAEFISTEGEAVGSATLTGAAEGVLFEIEVEGLPEESWLALHVHEVGECNPDDEFESAGGHFDPTDRSHGYLAEGGPHAGDMPNQYVGADGVMRAEVFNSFVTLGDGESDVMGRAIVIHDGRDDYESQPTGDAGGRLACAVIE